MYRLIFVLSVVFVCFSQTGKTIIAQSKHGGINARVKEHYGNFCVYKDLILINTDGKFYYLLRKKEPIIMLPTTKWAIDSVWIKQ